MPRKLDQIECRDAVLTPRPDGSFGEAHWPRVDFIIGNPPFLGDRRMIAGLGEDYVTSLREIYADRLPGRSDLVCYWFVKAAECIQGATSVRAGLVATNSISGGNNLPTLRFVTTRATIFEAWNDEPWIIEGAAVRVALVCFTNHDSNETLRLNGSTVETIGVDLTEANEAGIARALAENRNVSFIGTQKNGPFDVPGDLARSWLKMPVNPNGKSNTEVVRPWTNGSGIVRRNEDRWVIDFGAEMSETEASLFEAPFGHVAKFVKPTRLQLRRQWHRTKWWLHGDPRPALRRSLQHLARYVATPRVSKHRVFVWAHPIICLDSAAVAIARDDDTTFGILHSRHEAWSLRLGTWLGVGNDPRYTPTTTFETFPFPESLSPNIPAPAYAADPRAIRIATAAKKLDGLRRIWLNPPDLVRIEPEVAPGYPDRTLPKDADAAKKLKVRTLTNLYNQRPQWLADVHEALDRAVAAAYGWPEDISTDEALEKLLALNLARRTRQEKRS